MNCIYINTVIVANLAILFIIFVSGTQGLQSSKVEQVSSDNSSDCWPTANITCIKTIVLDRFKDIWNKKEIRLTDSVVIEKTGNVSTEDKVTLKVKSTEEARGYFDADQMVENIGKFLSTHALRIDLWNSGTLRIERSQENPENFEITFHMNRGTTNNYERAKDSHTWKVIVPLVMGFKMTGVLIFAITAVKLFLLKVFAVSQLALLAAGFLVVRKLMSSMAAQQHPYQFTHQPLHYYNDYGLAEGLPYSNYLTAGGNYVAPTGHGFEASASEEPATSAADDLQAHFSNNVLTNVKISAANHTTTNKHGKQRRILRPVKSRLNRIPVVTNRIPILTYRKVVDTGRSS